ncbi:1,4-dihydroxy-2-naphthoateoctaprenyltransferase [Beutenbergia cavernae DSM 12333]|uniref:1,4-dihydroxy-2-naphthoate octaprenyltransferase n=1 Tax=Beutenbergia cavernae (strain ATCC BAA-8 / DSM 12333 / CCUG 43141 / JCM 11478 / NBRC 16432 / NCIMB 13614 / HKI 0122) TaxID=471853 RepID=C5C182_BEUC1|nr:1,4-dihydroxy-2-naphthoate polyprenyltransferase [Beutenbergia cavernae]ACQ81492.1 1,4-dihydroxy-2-naphthoateoctaprenyltransferase [Beutenbergia cavernae DSM 12333]
MASAAQWIEGARLRTLPAALAPVAVGTGAAAGIDGADVLTALLCAGVALALQVGVNYANDYSDGVRGTDDVRAGPLRLVGSGAATPGAVRSAAFAAFAVAGIFGLAICWRSGAWWLLAVGAVCVLAAWGYTGGRSPYGYRGLGEVAVFTFFGLVATLGTTYVQALTISLASVAGAVGVGLLACALLMANNIRDIPTDTTSGKRTLAVRLGDPRARATYTWFLVIAFAMVVVAATQHPWALLALATVPWALVLVRRVRGGATGRDLIVVLRDTGLLELGYGVLLGLGLLL